MQIEKRAPTADDMDKINGYATREMKSDEVYVFSVVLCDNDLDRDFEKFSNTALDKLAELFIGKTMLSDHDTKSENQTARIFSTSVESVDGQFTRLSEPYKRVAASAYLIPTDSNKDFITEIEAGIKKEVSVGCAVSNSVCSICGKNRSCNHMRGKEYDGKICYMTLDNPTDAYECSFVAVPAQRAAGVIKHFDPQKAADPMSAITAEQVSKMIADALEKQFPPAIPEATPTDKIDWGILLSKFMEVKT